MNNLIENLKQSPIGKNTPISPSLLASANLKLKQSNLPPVPAKFAVLLQTFNGLSNEGALVFGAEINSTLFIDLIKYNQTFFRGNPSKLLVLGYDEVFFLLFDSKANQYHIVDRDTFEPELSSDEIDDPIAYLLRIA